MISPPPSSTLFPYTTLFRSEPRSRSGGAAGHRAHLAGDRVRRILPATAARGAEQRREAARGNVAPARDRKSTRLNSSHTVISYAVFCLKKKKQPLVTLTNVL